MIRTFHMVKIKLFIACAAFSWCVYFYIKRSIGTVKQFSIYIHSSICNVFPLFRVSSHSLDCVMNNLFNWTTYWNAFSWMKMHEFPLRFHWSLFLGVQITIFQHWFRWWLGACQATSHCLNQWWLMYWRIYASRGLNELKDRRKQTRIYFSNTTLFMEMYFLSKRSPIWRSRFWV